MSFADLRERIATIARGHRDIRSIAVFGSYARGEETVDSDVDLLIEFEPDARVGFVRFLRLQKDFSTSLQKKVDLLTRESVNPHIRADVLTSARTVYAK